jgi:hypothetical protein
MLQQMQTRHTTPAFVSAREVVAQVTQGKRTEHRIAQSVYHNISIGMPIQTAFVRNRYTSEH